MSFELILHTVNLNLMSHTVSQIDSIETDTIKKSIIIDFNANFSYQPFRKQNVEMLYSGVKSVFGDKFADYSYTINTFKTPC